MKAKKEKGEKKEPKETKVKKRDEKEDPLAHEAKEFLRRKIIGQTVHVFKDYTREPLSEEQEKRTYATIYIANTKENVGASLVRAGYAEVVVHRPGDDRSREYEELCAAEKEAKKKRPEKEKKDQVVNLKKNAQLWITLVNH